MSNKTAILILNWNGLDDTKRCLASLKEVRTPDTDIFILDNNSSNKEADQLRAHVQGRARIFRADTNLGFTGGVNLLLEQARHTYPDYYLLLNNDVEVTPTFLDELIAALDEDEAIGIAGPLIRGLEDHSQVVYGGGYFNWPTGKLKHKTVPPADVSIEKFVTGTSMLMRADVLQQIGYLDDQFFAYFEDAAYCISAQKHGYKCAIVPKSVIYHKVSGSSDPTGRFQTYLMARNRILFVNSYLSVTYRIYFGIYNFGKLLLACCYFYYSNRPDRAKAFARGYIDGVRSRGGEPTFGEGRTK